MKNLQMMIVVSIFLVSCASDPISISCPPDNRTVYVPSDCTKGYEIFATSYQTQISANLETLKIKAGVNASIVQSVTKLAQELDQRTSRFRTAYVGLCQSQISQPCNQDFQQKVLDARTSLATQFEQTERSLSEITKKVDVLSRTSSAHLQEEIVQDLQNQISTVKSAKP